MVEYGILLDDRVIVGPKWESVADVMYSFHGFGAGRAYGQLVVRDQPDQEWRPA